MTYFNENIMDLFLVEVISAGFQSLTVSDEWFSPSVLKGVIFCKCLKLYFKFAPLITNSASLKLSLSFDDFLKSLKARITFIS